MIDRARYSEYGEQKVRQCPHFIYVMLMLMWFQIFTLVDTNTMTVTLFSAARPPIALLLCGREGGMQRAVGCSYDWTTQTLYRETVLRMETPVRGKVAPVPRVKLGLRRPKMKVRRVVY